MQTYRPFGKRGTGAPGAPRVEAQNFRRSNEFTSRAEPPALERHAAFEPASREGEKKFCRDCGATINAKAEICTACGVRQMAVGTGMVVPKSRSAAIVLALLLGGVGAHKFYLRQPGLGILYMIFVWTFVPAVIALLEGITYLLMSDEEFAERYKSP